MFLGSVHLLWYDETIQFNFPEANDLSDGKKIFKMCQLFRKHYKSTIQLFFNKNSIHKQLLFWAKGIHWLSTKVIINCTINQQFSLVKNSKALQIFIGSATRFSLRFSRSYVISRCWRLSSNLWDWNYIETDLKDTLRKNTSKQKPFF